MDPVSKRIATIALAPRCCASAHIRPITTWRLSYMTCVYSGISPPPSDRNPAVKLCPKSVERTVRPMTSPSTCVMRYPGTSFVVTMNMRTSCQKHPSLTRAILPMQDPL